MRVALQPSYILHSRPYRDTSLLLDVFTPEQGRLSLVAKGARRRSRGGSNVALLHSMDRQGLAEKWATRSTAPVLLQFNLAAESQKSGFDPSEADRVIDDVLGLGVRVVGVMAIPPMADDPEDVRPWFVKLRGLFDRYAATYDDITVCSMGMSHDLEVAIEEGATMVRVGRAIFAG